ncbi:uncharacterized protein HMPREF1541_02726 [Cyphellophora europaea CBS 101466]|uniref:Carbohydrate kinase PfkB domain-containing protein n=1 Tax=Cyphellophora europaea (strain CBS 101466) TaxID=1220924 RepID=W2S4F3_CYPE1|nr:uncharacterized protein HMPREF1541_02726 [Cyphellophora europaea CBS 101466]ETN43567.1 hypothetical protein HMPREF1541_02726 [Cyphellophora europaea CBS 101466]
MKHLVVVGACYLDTILTVPHYPGEDEKLRATSISHRRGGNGPNTLEVLAQLLHHKIPDNTRHPTTIPQPASPRPSLHLISTLPSKQSQAVSNIASSLDPTVDIDHSIFRESHTEPASSYIVRSSTSGSRTIVNYNDLPEMTEHDFQSAAEQLLSDAETWWFHFEGRIPEVTLRCIRYVRERCPEATVSVEVEKPQREGLEDLARAADVVFYSRSWAAARGYTSAAECVKEQAVRTRRDTRQMPRHAGTPSMLSICTWGEHGAALYAPAWQEPVEAPALEIADGKVVDTIGAGDTFIAGMLHGFLSVQERFADFVRILVFANELAGLKVMREGFDGLAEDVYRRATDLERVILGME